MSESMNLAHFENILGRTSALTSHFADCYDLDEDVEVDEDLLERVEEIILSVQHLHSSTSKDYQRTINQLKAIQKGFKKSFEEDFGCYEMDIEEMRFFSEAHGAILDYCEEKWEEHRAKRLGTQS